MTDLLLVLPVLARPQRVDLLVTNIYAATQTLSFRILFVCSQGDEDQIEACKETGSQTHVMLDSAGPGDYAKKVNRAYQLSREPLLFLGADDLTFHPGWDAKLAAYLEYDVGVVGTNDLHNSRVVEGRHSTHPVVRRCYIEEHGGTADGSSPVYFEGYDHNYCDDELVHVAQSRGCFLSANDCWVEHDHPDWGRGAWDPTYAKGKALFEQDRQLYVQREKLWSRRQKARA